MKERQPSPRALIVDDHDETREALTEVAELSGFSAANAGTLADAQARLSETTPDVLLIDLQLPDGKGLDLLRKWEDQPRPEVILITGHATVDSAVEALRTGVLDYLVKPVDVPRLKTVLANVSRTLAFKREIGQLRGQLLELGRACIEREHRDSVVLMLLWKGIYRYACETGARYLVGCSSLTSQDPAEGLALYEALREKYLVPEPFRTVPRCGSKSLSNSRATEDLPEPLGPTMPIFSPAATVKDSPSCAARRPPG